MQGVANFTLSDEFAATEDEDFSELLLDSGSLLKITEEELFDFTELDEDSDFTELDDEAFTLLDVIPADVPESPFLLLLDPLEDDDFAFSLLDDFFWMLELEDFTELLLDCFASLAITEEELLLDSSLALRMTDEDDSIPGSSLASTDADESSPHPTKTNAAKKNNIKQEIAIHFLLIPTTRLIKPSKLNLSATNIALKLSLN